MALQLLSGDIADEMGAPDSIQEALAKCIAFHAASSREKTEMGVSDVLFAILSKKGSHAAYLLNSQSVTLLDMMNYVSHGLARP